jgi:cobaltochelatase CobN
MAQYKAWFAQLPRRFREETIARWGPPDAATLMTVTRDGTRYFVVPGIRFGNIFVGPQPLRSTFDDYQNMGHDTVTPVPHQYVAAYLWYRHQFKADAIVHVGRHGTLEWLPGKQTAQAGWDASEVLLGDVPDPYYYIVDGDGEALQAKRRGAAVLISHLTPMIVNGGERPEFKPLHDALENLEKTEGTSASLADEYRRSAMAEIRRLKLDAQLGMSLDTLPWDELEARVHRFLHDTEGNTLPLGLHTVGEAPPERNQREGLAAFLKSGFEDAEASLVADDVQAWAAAIFDGRTPEIAGRYAPALREKIRKGFDDGRAWVDNVRQSPARELDSLIAILDGRHIATAPFGNPLQVAASIPTGRNEHAFDTALIPTKAAWAVGRKMADDFVSAYRKQHNAYPDKISQVLWGGETLRHQGAFESMALALLGVEPVWNARGIVDDVQLIPDAQLGRPRVDVVFSVSGGYRDALADKVLLLDRAVRLAASAGDNSVSRHDREVAAALRASGVAGELADQIGRARVFSNKPGAYGVGVQQIVEQSRDADGHTADLASLYMHYTNFAYSSELWGGSAEGALAGHLKGNQAVLFSRTSSLYGALDNDDVYQYFGALGLASKTVNGGAAPDMFIHNLRKSGSESMTDLKGWLASELNARNWNPKWLTEMQRSGYGGAREMAKSMEHLYGFQATTAEQVDGTFWQNSYDVLVADKYGLGMDQFFQDKNPYAQQSILARMIEVDRQGSYKFSDADRETLVRKYVESVARNGVNCISNTCVNQKVQQYIAEQAGLIEGLGQQVMQRYGQQLARATGWNARDFPAAPTAVTAGMRAAAAAQAPPPPPTPAAAPVPPDVSGFKLEERVTQLANPASAELSVWPFVGMALAILYGILRERRRLAV